MLSTSAWTRIYDALILETDKTFQQAYHQTLNEVLNDLKIHYSGTFTVSSPQHMLHVIQQSNVLFLTPTPSVVRLRSALNKLEEGTFGSCERCGREINERVLESDPTVQLCPECVKGRELTKAATNSV